MPLKSAIFRGTAPNARLEQAANGPPSIKRAPPADDIDAIQRIQRALVALGHPLPKSFSSGPTQPPDGKYGAETHEAVLAFQKRVFIGQPSEWDGRVGKNTLAKMDSMLPAGAGPSPTPPAPPLPPGPPATFIVHDVRLFGWKPAGDALEVNGDTPLQWMIDNAITRGKANGGNLVVKIMSHGLPGFVQCCQGKFMHPTLATNVVDPAKGNLYIGPGKPGISVQDLDQLSQLKGHVKRIEFHSCLVARIGPCFEANGHTGYDGNAFCFQLAQRTAAEVVASIHLQFYWKGNEGPVQSKAMHFGNWNGRVFTWGPAGNVIDMQTYAYKELDGPPPPGTPAT